MPVEQPGGLFGRLERQRVEDVFLTLLDRCMEQGLNLSHSKNASGFAPKVFAQRPDADGYTRRDFDAAMPRLFAEKRIVVEDYGRKSDARQRIARAPEMAQ